MSDSPAKKPVIHLSRGEKRSAARLAAVQALYQMDLTQKGVIEVLGEFESYWMGREIEGDQYKPAERGLFRQVIQGVMEHQLALDRAADRILTDGWPLARIEALLRAVLRAGFFELAHALDVPVKVVVSEYVDIASAFLDRDEVAMANAVLDRFARETRASELAR
jgi:N utilization substance protein B